MEAIAEIYLHQRLAESLQKVENDKEEKAKLSAEIAKLQSEVNRYEKKIQEQQDDKAKSNLNTVTREENEEKLIQAEQQINTLKVDIENLSQQINVLKNENSQLKKATEELSIKLNDKSASLKAHQEKLVGFQQLIDSHKHENGQLKKENEELLAKMNAKSASLEKQKKKLVLSRQQISILRRVMEKPKTTAGSESRTDAVAIQSEDTVTQSTIAEQEKPGVESGEDSSNLDLSACQQLETIPEELERETRSSASDLNMGSSVSSESDSYNSDEENEEEEKERRDLNDMRPRTPSTEDMGVVSGEAEAARLGKKRVNVNDNSPDAVFDAKRARIKKESKVSVVESTEALNEWLTDESVRSLLHQRPHTTKELLAIFTQRCPHMDTAEIVRELAAIIKRLPVRQFKQKQGKGRKMMLFFELEDE